MQSKMSYKTFTWPNNPETVSVTGGRCTVQNHLMNGSWVTQEFGNAPRVYSGEGIFAGSGAYASFLALQTLLRAGGAGTLTHPQWGSVSAYFTALEAVQEPRENFVRYKFTFLEAAA